MNIYNINRGACRSSTVEKQFCDLYTDLRQELYLFFYRRTKNDDLAQDLTQDVFLKFWMLKDKYPQVENIKAYLKQMAKNVFNDFSKHKKMGLAYEQVLSREIDVTEAITQAFIDERELTRRFQQAILLLSKQRRTVFVLAKLEGWPRKKIALALGISENTVKVTLQKAIRNIKECMGIEVS
jgi:RNA polymerase sigma-70 factor (ECF subfamily)